MIFVSLLCFCYLCIKNEIMKITTPNIPNSFTVEIIASFPPTSVQTNVVNK